MPTNQTQTMLMRTNKTEELGFDTYSHHSSSLNRSVSSIRKLRSGRLRVEPNYQLNRRTPRESRNSRHTPTTSRISRHNIDELNDDLPEMNEKKNQPIIKKNDTPNFEDLREFRSLRSSEGFNLSMLVGSQAEELN